MFFIVRPSESEIDHGLWGRPLLLTALVFLAFACGNEGATNSTGVAGSDAGFDVTSQVDSAQSDAADAASDAGAGDAASTETDAVDASVSSDALSPDATAPSDIGSLDVGVNQGCAPACSADQMCVSGTCQKIEKPCGGLCKLNEYCDGGTKGTCKTSACTMPSTFSKDVQKVSYMQIEPSNEGCDLDGDGKVNNVFGKLLKVYPAANTELLKSIQDGLFILLFEADGYKTDGTQFAINGYLGELDDSNPKCSPTAGFSNCKYTVDEDNFGSAASGVCPTQVRVEPATIKSGALDAGGKIGQTMTIKLPVVGGLEITLSSARMLGTTTDTASWQTTKKGRICGVITSQDFKKAIDAVPADAWKEIGLEKSLIEQVLATFLAPDIDLNKDGTMDAISLSLTFEGVPGQITKVY
ncbi:MAG: hypothetical protein KC502_14065 [Myxococcales bacterium]|nr:hypothetical protein [Myxococcales bacterium]